MIPFILYTTFTIMSAIIIHPIYSKYINIYADNQIRDYNASHQLKAQCITNKR